MKMEMGEEQTYWLALSLLNKKLNVHEIEKAYRGLGSVAKIWNSELATLEKFGLSGDALPRIEKVRSTVSIKTLRERVNRLRELKVQMITFRDPAYPALLRGLMTGSIQAPLVLFHKGALLDMNNCVAIVGTRNLSFGGYLMARQFATAIAGAGYAVVTGLARGTDAIANRAAMEIDNAQTVAVLPWMEPLYPPEHERLASDIQQRGAIISENLCSEDVRGVPTEFVERNRITSGISHCLVAIESEEKGGTVHQVNIALSQGKRVFVVEPQTDDPKIISGHRLFIGMGAIPVNSPQTVLEFLTRDRHQTLPDYYSNQRQ